MTHPQIHHAGRSKRPTFAYNSLLSSVVFIDGTVGSSDGAEGVDEMIIIESLIVIE
jgi:hypothetical protein